MDNVNLLTSSAFLHLGKANEFALLSVYETSSAFEVLSASCCLSYSPLRYRRDSPASPIEAFTGCLFMLVVLRNAIESHGLSSYSKSQEMNL